MYSNVNKQTLNSHLDANPCMDNRPAMQPNTSLLRVGLVHLVMPFSLMVEWERVPERCKNSIWLYGLYYYYC